METPIKVVFRRFKEGGIIALFPYIPWNESENTITSYMHAGQAWRSRLQGNHLRDTARNGKKNIGTCWQRLKSIGYGNLHVLNGSHGKTEVSLIILLKMPVGGGGMFYCCNGLNDLKALVDKGMEDFAHSRVTDFRGL